MLSMHGIASTSLSAPRQASITASRRLPADLLSLMTFDKRIGEWKAIIPTAARHAPICRHAGGCGWVVGTLVGVPRCHPSASSYSLPDTFFAGRAGWKGSKATVRAPFAPIFRHIKRPGLQHFGGRKRCALDSWEGALGGRIPAMKSV